MKRSGYTELKRYPEEPEITWKSERGEGAGGRGNKKK
jgi:hypothetical protein